MGVVALALVLVLVVLLVDRVATLLLLQELLPLLELLGAAPVHYHSSMKERHHVGHQLQPLTVVVAAREMPAVQQEVAVMAVVAAVGVVAAVAPRKIYHQDHQMLDRSTVSQHDCRFYLAAMLAEDRKYCLVLEDYLWSSTALPWIGQRLGTSNCSGRRERLQRNRRVSA